VIATNTFDRGLTPADRRNLAPAARQAVRMLSFAWLIACRENLAEAEPATSQLYQLNIPSQIWFRCDANANP
jgi:hypothetical protein